MTGKLLVIDDDQTSRRLLKDIFEPEGFTVIEANDGRSGIEGEASQLPDVAFVDLHLPDMLGTEVLAELRTKRPHLPVVILTGHAEVKKAVRATQLGAFDYLTKPIDTEEVLVVGRRALETSALRAEVEQLRRKLAEDPPRQEAIEPTDPVTDRSLKEIADMAAREAERRAICRVLRSTLGNKSRAAKALKTDYKTLHIKMKLLGIVASDFNEASTGTQHRN